MDYLEEKYTGASIATQVCPGPGRQDSSSLTSDGTHDYISSLYMYFR
jgi:hypothetical protein